MFDTQHQLQQYLALAADRHERLLADAARHRLAPDLPGPLRRICWMLGDLLLAAGHRLTVGRPVRARVAGPQPSQPTLSVHS